MNPKRAPLWLFLLSLAFPCRAPAQAPDATLRRAVSLINSSRPQEAEELLRSALERDGAQPDALTLVGFLYLRRAATLEAERAFSRALEVDPGMAAARLGLGLAWAQAGRPADAARELEAVVHDPVLGHRARGQWIYSLFLQGKDDDALREARGAAARFPAVSEYQSLLGLFEQARGNSRAAREHYRRAVELEPTRMPAYFSLIGQYRDARDWKSALEWIDAALELDRNHPLLYAERAVACEKLGRKVEADSARRQAQGAYEAEVRDARAAAARGCRIQAGRLEGLDRSRGNPAARPPHEG